AVPDLSTKYESNVPGLYVIGALAGNPLIKQAMNQGYEVIEHILGEPVQPADHPLLEARLAVLPYGLDVDDSLALLQQRIPMFRALTGLQFRELMLDSQVIAAGAEYPPGSGQRIKVGDTLFRKGDYTNSFFTVVDGEMTMVLDEAGSQ